MGSGLAWTNRLSTDGTLTVFTAVSTLPPNLLWNVNGTRLTLAWPADHTGWRLLMNPNLTGTNWVDVSPAGPTNQTTMPIVTTNASVFYRLVYP